VRFFVFKSKVLTKREMTMKHIGALWMALAAIGGLWCSSLFSDPAVAQTANSPYALSVFAKSAPGYSQPDSIALGRNSVFIGFQNHVAKDGSDGKSSTIVEYSLSGAVKRMFSVQGHNDGLRVIGDDLWALQNEDANPNLAIIELPTGRQKVFTLPAPHGGGYDDLRVFHDQIFLTASNPNLDSNGVNNFPALVRFRFAGSGVALDPVLAGNATATDIPSGASVTLNLTDPDSLSVDERGNIVVNSQADAELVFVRHPLEADETAGRISITTAAGPTTVDDTAFVPEGASFMLFSDVGGDTIYRLDAPKFGFEPGTAYSTSDTAGIVGVLNLDTGVLTPIATGFSSTRGMAFVGEDRDRDLDHHAFDRDR
jgi:hypothetical protein